MPAVLGDTPKVQSESLAVDFPMGGDGSARRRRAEKKF